MRAGRAPTARGERLSPEPARGSWERGFAADTRPGESWERGRRGVSEAGRAGPGLLRCGRRVTFGRCSRPSFACQPGDRRPPPWAGGRRSGGAAAGEERLGGGQQVPRCAAAWPAGGRQPCSVLSPPFSPCLRGVRDAPLQVSSFGRTSPRKRGAGVPERAHPESSNVGEGGKLLDFSRAPFAPPRPSVRCPESVGLQLLLGRCC